MSKAMLIDTSNCLFCNACTVECKRENNVVVGKDIFWTQMVTHETGQFPNVRQYFVKRACNHCTQAACVDVCPTGALYHHPDGFVVLDQSKCNGCGYCSQACPFGIPQLDVANTLTGQAKSNKCTFCVQRTSNGGQTACSLACPFGAITYGDRDKLIAQGKERVAALQAKGVSKAQLYGEHEMGGLHVLYVLEEQPEVYGLPSNPQYPVLATLWQNIVQPLGGIAILGTAAALGFNWLVARRKIHVEEE